MSTARLQLLPFEQLDHEQFESFLLQFLGAGISLEVIERPLAFTPVPPEQTAPPAPASVTARYRLVRATSVGTSGQKQHGIDLIAYTESGAQWVFQCKHWPKKKFDVAAAEEVIAKANTEYPEARRYFAVLSHPATKPVDVRRVIEADPKWQLWEPSEIWTRFQNEVPRGKQLDIVRRFFGDETANQLYPLQHDCLLLSATDYFARGSPINFSTGFVGREAERAQLLAFARSPGPTAAILSAPGGIGKTRLLREFAERLSAESPDLRVLFLNPYASAQANTDALRVAEEGKLVVVFDDAHRSETLLDNIADSVAAKKGRLLLAARPQSVEALRAWSANHGFPTSEPIRLPPLDDALLQRLAAAELGTDLAPHAGRIVSLADHNALIVTVAAELLKQEPQSSIRALLASENFGRRILDRLADKTLESAFSDHTQRERARDVLHVLAILAPWTEEVLPLDRIATLLDLGGREFDRVRDALLAARLVVRTGRGLRVVPDLLADHLVRQACFEAGPERRLTSLAVAIQKEFAPNISCTSALHVIRNLAEAEAQQGASSGELLAPFWDTFRHQFEGAQLWMRAHLLHEWASFAVTQPARSLELARLAVDTIDRPPAPDGLGTEIEDASSPTRRNQVLAATTDLLEPLAAHCPSQRSAALDLIWDLDLKTAAVGDSNTSSALDALGRIANWDNHQSLDAVRVYLAWLGAQLRSPAGTNRLLLRPSPALSVLLKPVFECSFDWIESAPGSTEARLNALPESDTEPVYTAALDLIEQLALPAGEVAVLNIHGALESALAVAPHHGSWRSLPTALRLRALRLVSTVLKGQPSPRVAFRFRETLRSLLAHEPEEMFPVDAQAVLAAIPDTEELRLATVLLSNPWKEFYHSLPPSARPEARAENRHYTRWMELADSVATTLASRHPEAAGLLAELERLDAEYSAVGEHADFTELLLALGRVSQTLALGVAEVALSQPDTNLDRSLPSLLPDKPLPTPSIVEQLAAQAFATPNRERSSAFLRWLTWRGRAHVTPTILAHVTDWSAQIDDTGLQVILPNISLSSAALPELADSIFAHLPLARLSDASIVAICQCLERQQLESDSLRLPSGFCARLIAELQRLDRLEFRHGRTCLPLLAAQEPRRFFEMLLYRVRNRTGIGSSLPFSIRESIPLHGLCNEPDYPSLARELLGELRRSKDSATSGWITLFQWAVLSVSPIGLQLLDEWLQEVSEPKDLERLFRCLSFPRSTLVFERPAFVRRILARVQSVAPSSEERRKLTNTLCIWSGPLVRSYSGGDPDPVTRRYREEAAKAAAIHAADPELAAFYRLIVEQEDARFAFSRRPHTSDAEWSYD